MIQAHHRDRVEPLLQAQLALAAEDEGKLNLRKSLSPSLGVAHATPTVISLNYLRTFWRNAISVPLLSTWTSVCAARRYGENTKIACHDVFVLITLD